MALHLLALADERPQDLLDTVSLGIMVKQYPTRYRESCRGQTLAMIFQKPSLRTRVSFATGIFQLGGQGIYLAPKDIQLHRGETIEDTARVLARYVDGVMARVNHHEDLVALAAASSVPVINGLSDLLHPCQVLADLMTIQEVKGTLAGLKVAYIGDGNNMAHSLMVGCAKVGMHIAVAHPEGYAPDAGIVAVARQTAEASGASVTLTGSPAEAAAGADIVYTDVWTSMGQEEEQAARRLAFTGYCVDEAVMGHAKPDATFMHCLPAHRGEEVSAAVIDGPRSVVFDQAENRLHAQKAVMIRLMRR
ncbi:MAG: ornithine carbamoyltransferase [Myxococcota bacterium]|jgi:ornithine carbamoyltransferase